MTIAACGIHALKVNHLSLLFLVERAANHYGSRCLQNDGHFNNCRHRQVRHVVAQKKLECALHISGEQSAASQCVLKKHAPNDVEVNSSHDLAENVI